MVIYTIVVVLILLGRAAFVFPLSAISNRMNTDSSHRRTSITFKQQVSSLLGTIQMKVHTTIKINVLTVGFV